MHAWRMQCARLVRQGPHDGAEDHGGAKASDEQAADVAPVEAIVLVQRIHVGALKPVAGCMAGRCTSVCLPDQLLRSDGAHIGSCRLQSRCHQMVSCLPLVHGADMPYTQMRTQASY